MLETSPNFIVRLHQGGCDYAYLRRIFQAADALGYDGASLYDLLGIPTLECWTTLSALAAETERIRLIPMVLANLYRHPATLAKMAATLDVISDGRLVLGIGAGGGEGDHKAYGLPYPSTRERARMLSEAAQVIRLLWSGERVSFDGEYYRLDNALCDPAPAQHPSPRLLIGGHGERYLLRVAAQHADITNMHADMSIAEHHTKRRVLHVHCRAVGRDPSAVSLSHNASVFIGKDEAAVDAMLAEHATRHGISPQRFKANLGNAIVGTPQQCIDQLRQYTDYGIRWFFLLFPEPVSVGNLELFASEVMPEFKSVS
ncbi:MAG: LLM class flavin-dependent oxidoreductase [Chloroflexi bacterium]|nr:LLM class flavin-dependent oxidoreductase [Chloroflexota bacterium]